MSKGNMFLGGARGSVGDVTLQVLNGQQITKRRNRNPKNPKTKKQMYQRASFAEPVKFFTRGQQNLFKFAFENKANGESDYNAFMRVNAKLGVLMTKQQIENPFIAKFGNFCITQGSMTGLSAEKLVFAEVGGEGVVGIQTNMLVDTLPTTVGELSAVILDSFKSMQNGDIITTLQIVTDNLTPGEIPYVVSDGEFEPIWYINQIILDRNDSTPLASAWSLSKSADGKLIIANADALSGEEFCGCSLIISRNIPGGVKVSTSYIKNSDRVQQVIDIMKPNFVDPEFSDPWATEVLASWSATDEAILQGSLAAKASTTNIVVEKVQFTDAPYTAARSLSANTSTVTFTLEGEGLSKVTPADITIVEAPEYWSRFIGFEEQVEDTIYDLKLYKQKDLDFLPEDSGHLKVKVAGVVVIDCQVTFA